MTLNDTKLRCKARVVDIECEKDIKRRLGSLGLFEGVVVQVINRNFGIAVVEVLYSTKIGIDEDVLKDIYVQMI